MIVWLLAETITRPSAPLSLLPYKLVFISPMVGIAIAVHSGLTTVEKAEEWRTNPLKNFQLIAGTILRPLGMAMLNTL